MKKLNKYSMIIALMAMVTISCNPLEDELDQIEDNFAISKEVTYTLADDDYEDMKDYVGIPSYVASDYYFIDDAEASDYIPQLMSDKFDHLGIYPLVAVTFNVLVKEFDGTEVIDDIFYTVTTEDYNALGHTFGNFDAQSEIFEMLDFKYPNVAEGTLVILTYDFYNGSREPRTQTQTDGYYYSLGVWNKAFRVTNAYYEYFERNRFNNFTSADDDNLEGYQNYMLSQEYPSAKAGDVEYISYAYYNGSFTEQRVDALQFDGVSWSLLEDNVLDPFTLNFSKKESGWFADLTIKYTLTRDNFTTIGNAWLARNLEGAESALQYGNFDVQLWTEEQRFTAIVELLPTLYPNPEEGQKYEISYPTWEPGSGTRIAYIIYQDGEYQEYTPTEE